MHYQPQWRRIPIGRYDTVVATYLGFHNDKNPTPKALCSIFNFS